MNTYEKALDNQVEVKNVSVASNEQRDEKQDLQDREQARELVSRWVNGSPEEKKLLRKLDWRIIVC